MKNFFRATFKSIRYTGIIYPSSKHLVSEMIRHIDFQNGTTFVEFGTGNGCLTEAIINQMRTDATLLSFELNEDFYHFSARKFSKEERVRICNDNAINFDAEDYLSKTSSIDAIISSLPLSLIKDSDLDILFNKVKQRLDPRGKMIQYQYSLSKFNYLKEKFRVVNLNYTLLNLPPAFVYCCQI